MINTIFYFPASLNYNDYLSRLRNEELSNQTIVFAEEQLAIYFNGKRYNGIDAKEFHDKIEELYNDSWIKDALDGIRGDITAANGRIDVLNGLVRDVNDSLTQFMADLDTQIDSRLQDMFSDAQWIQRNWPQGVTQWQQGWNAEIQAYLRTVGYWDIDDYGNEITKWSKIQQSVNSISQQVNSLETNGPQSEAFSSSIDQKIDGKIAELNLGTTYAKAVDLDGTQQVIEWLYSGLKTTSSPDKTFAQLSSAGKSAVSEAIASIRTWVDKLADGTFAAGLDITAKVKNAVAGMISNVDNDGNALAALQAKADANSNDISAILLGIGGNSATADIQTRIQNVMSGFQSSSQVDGKIRQEIRQAKSSIYSALYAGTPDPITGEYDESQLISLSALKTIVDSDHSELEAITSTAGYSSGLLAKSELDSAMSELFASNEENNVKASVIACVSDNQSQLTLSADYITFSANKLSALGAEMTVASLVATNIGQSTKTVVNANGIHCGYGDIGDGTTSNPNSKVAFDVSANGTGSLGRGIITWDANDNGVVNIGNTTGTVNIAGNVIIDDTVTVKKLDATETISNVKHDTVVSSNGILCTTNHKTSGANGTYIDDNKVRNFYVNRTKGSLIGSQSGTVNISGNVVIDDTVTTKKLIATQTISGTTFRNTINADGISCIVYPTNNPSNTATAFLVSAAGQGQLGRNIINWDANGSGTVNIGNQSGQVNISGNVIIDDTVITKRLVATKTVSGTTFDNTVNSDGIECVVSTSNNNTTAFKIDASGQGQLGNNIINWNSTGGTNGKGVVNIGNQNGQVNISGNVIIGDNISVKKLDAIKYYSGSTIVEESQATLAFFQTLDPSQGVTIGIKSRTNTSGNWATTELFHLHNTGQGELGNGLINWDSSGIQGNGTVNIGSNRGTVNIRPGGTQNSHGVINIGGNEYGEVNISGNVNIADTISVGKLYAEKAIPGGYTFYEQIDPEVGFSLGIRNSNNQAVYSDHFIHFHSTGQGHIANGLINWDGSGGNWSNVELNLGNDGGTVNIHASRKWNSKTKAWSTGNVGEINIGTPKSYAIKQLQRDEITSSNYSSKVQGYNSWDALVNAGITPEINLWGDLKAKDGSDIRLEGGQIIALNNSANDSYDSNITTEDVTFNVDNSATTIIDKWGLKVKFDYNNTSTIMHELQSPNGYFRLGNNTISNMRSGGLFVGPTVVANGYSVHNYDSSNVYSDHKYGSTKGISGIIAMSNGTTYMLICNGIVIGMADITNVKNKFRNTYKWHQVEVWAANHSNGDPDSGCDLIAGTYAAMTAS